MNKQITSIALVFVMVVSLLASAVPVFAAGSTQLKVTADKTEASPGDIITFTITLGPVSEMGTMQMDLVIPEGLTYVANSGKLADGLKETLGFDTADWTEITKRINGAASAADYSSATDTEIAKFQCKVNEGFTGTATVGLDNLEFYSCQTWEDHTMDYSVVTVDVTVAAAHTHTGTLVEATAATCEDDGNIAYYTCSCNKWFKDEACTIEITDKASVVIKKTGHTEDANWSSDKDGHWKKCTECGDVVVAKTAHIPGPAATETTDQICTDCGWVINPATGKLSFNISVEQPENGTITVSSATAKAGEKVALTATPKTGYRLSYYKVDGNRINGNSFIMPNNDVTVTAVFVKKSSGGSYTPPATGSDEEIDQGITDDPTIDTILPDGTVVPGKKPPVIDVVDPGAGTTNPPTGDSLPLGGLILMFAIAGTASVVLKKRLEEI